MIPDCNETVRPRRRVPPTVARECAGLVRDHTCSLANVFTTIRLAVSGQPDLERALALAERQLVALVRVADRLQAATEGGEQPDAPAA